MRLSIVIAAWNGPASLERCLRSLEEQAGESEILAVTNFDWPGAGAAAQRLAGLRHVPLAPGATVPVLRAEGIRRSSGEIVALAEDHCTFAANWRRELLKAHELPHAALGGAVENGSSRSAVAWAVYFYDYGRFMLPLAAGPAPALCGMNVSYQRQALDEVACSFREGLFEPLTHGALAARGHALYLAPQVVVYHEKEYAAADAAAQAYHLARDYAGRRVRPASPLKRGAFVAGALLLPLLLTARVVIGTLRKRRLVTELLLSFPYLVVLTSSWSWGELCGYAAGSGSSADKWK